MDLSTNKKVAALVIMFASIGATALMVKNIYDAKPGDITSGKEKIVFTAMGLSETQFYTAFAIIALMSWIVLFYVPSVNKILLQGGVLTIACLWSATMAMEYSKTALGSFISKLVGIAVLGAEYYYFIYRG